MPAWAAPTGSATMVAANNPREVACPPCTLPAILPKMMYSAQQTAAPSA
ncbi:Uncharacterised protein [Achromobacter xylosoxidans]|nr:Uncharacterised protein [Achromobacter xylosoxidans]